METERADPGTDTIFIVLILVLIIGFIAWWFTMYRTDVTDTPADNSTINMDIDMPTPSGTITPTPDPTPPPSGLVP